MDTVGIWAAVLASVLVRLKRCTDVTTNDTLGGLDRIETPYQLKNSNDRAPPLGITTDVTPLKIVGLNNYS